MRKHELLFALILFILLIYGSGRCMAQQEDTLRLKHPEYKPELIIPNQLMQPPMKSLMPKQLGIDGLEYTPSSPTPAPKKDTIAPSLSVENFLKFYYQDFLKWEKDTYGINFDIHNFIMKNGKYIRSNGYYIRKSYLDQKASKAPYPLHPGFVPASGGIPITWKPSKQDIWFKENFGWEKRAIQLMSSQVDSFGNRSIYEVENLLRVDSIIEQNKLDSTGQFSPVPISYKKEINRIRKNIRKDAKQELK